MPNTINCLIIDDEPLARSLIRTLLQKKENYHIIGECTNPTEAHDWLLHENVDVIFLDIKMPVISGMEFSKKLKHTSKLIFTTAYANFAVDAFDLNALDYIVKPITEERFEQALKKLELSLHVKHAKIVTKSIQETDYIFLKTEGRLIKIQFEDIIYLEALKDFTKIYVKEGSQPILVGEHLKAIENLLPSNLYIRSHRSFLVSIKAITGIFGNTLEIGKIQLPIGGNYKDQLFRILNIK